MSPSSAVSDAAITMAPRMFTCTLNGVAIPQYFIESFAVVSVVSDRRLWSRVGFNDILQLANCT